MILSWLENRPNACALQGFLFVVQRIRAAQLWRRGLKFCRQNALRSLRSVLQRHMTALGVSRIIR
jgi:hypothetical protein